MPLDRDQVGERSQMGRITWCQKWDAGTGEAEHTRIVEKSWRKKYFVIFVIIKLMQEANKMPKTRPTHQDSLAHAVNQGKSFSRIVCFVCVKKPPALPF